MTAPTQSSALPIDAATYGVATSAIRQVIQLATNHRWFPELSLNDAAKDAVRKQLVRHWEAMGDHAISQLSHVEFVHGSWRKLAEVYALANPERDLSPYGRGRWREFLALLAGEARSTLEQSHREAVVPPLFPVPGNAGIVARMLAAKREDITMVSEPSPRQAVWHLMCDVDSDFWSTIISLLVNPDLDQNPFASLVAIYESGFYPLGFVDDAFLVFSYRPDPFDP
jgi:hypothetical protein